MLPARRDVSEEDNYKPDPDIIKLMDLNPDALWRHLGRYVHQDAIQLLQTRMATGAVPLVITGHEQLSTKVKDAEPSTQDFLAATRVLLSHLPPAKAEAQLEAARFFAVRALAQGHATSLPSAIALRLFLGDASTDGLHGQVATGYKELYSSAPLTPEMEKRIPFLTQLELGIESLPSQRGTHFIGLNLQTPSGKLTEVLNGDKGIGSFHPGSSIIWRGIGSVTSDPMLAKDAATKGKGVALILKIRSNTSRDVGDFAFAPDLKERLFPPRRYLRVAGIYPMEDMFLRKGLAMAGGMHALLEAFEAPDIVTSTGAGSALTWEQACSRRACCVVLDEEEIAATASSAMM